MKLTIFGATGGTGLHGLRQALDAGHQVTAVVRDPDRLPADLRERADIVTTDVMDTAAIEDAVAGRDAVISTIGTRDLRSPTSVCTDSTGSIITAMQAAGTPRLITASNTAMHAGPGDDPFTRYVVKPLILRRLLRHMLADMAETERQVRGSGLDWTIVRAGRLTDRPGKGAYRSALDRNVFGGVQIGRADFATALLDAAANTGSVRHTVSVAN